MIAELLQHPFLANVAMVCGTICYVAYRVTRR